MNKQGIRIWSSVYFCFNFTCTKRYRRKCSFTPTTRTKAPISAFYLSITLSKTSARIEKDNNHDDVKMHIRLYIVVTFIFTSGMWVYSGHIDIKSKQKLLKRRNLRVCRLKCVIAVLIMLSGSRKQFLWSNMYSSV